MLATLNSFAALPAQMIPLKKKDKQWKTDTLDTLEQIGRAQFFDNNATLIENYELVKGRFIYHHYFEREDYYDLVTNLTQEFNIPSHLRHYDIISPVINTLSGEYQKRPDTFRVRAMDEESTNQYLRQKSDLLHRSMLSDIQNEIAQNLMAQGIDVNKKDFISDEDKKQHDEQVQQATQQMMPPQIEKYMKYSWRATAEIWGEHRLEADRERFDLPEKEKKEFEDMLISDRCFRHFYLTATGYEQETWNPVNTFFHKSPEIDRVEDGDYAGRIFFLSIPAIIDRYGHFMTSEEIESLYDNSRQTKVGGVMNEFFDATSVPFGTFRSYNDTVNSFGFDPINGSPGQLNNRSLMDVMFSSVGTWIDTNSLVQVTEAYWKSQRKIGRITFLDPETGEPVTTLVDETFDARGFKELKDNTLSDIEEPNTIIWTWVNQIWRGIKINKHNSNLSEDMYVGIQPTEFQFKGDYNPYGAKLPVCGQIFNNRNAQSMSLVDLMKPDQIGYNVAMNQLYEIMQREIGRFALMDINLIPSLKDWGGEKSYEKFMMVAKSMGIGLVDTSPLNSKQASFNSFQTIDLDETARMLNRGKLAEFFEMQAMKKVGMTPQRLGEMAATETATATEKGLTQSFAQTESYFTNFNNYKKRCLRMNLEIAQFVESQEKDIVVMHTQSDLGRGFIKLAGTELLLKDLQVYVSNSQETIRVLETLRQLAINNNTSNASILDLATIISSNSIAEIKQTLKDTLDKQDSQQQAAMDHEQQMSQQQVEATAQEQEKQRAFEAEQNDLNRANERYISEVRAMGFSKDTDTNTDGIPDVLEVQKFDLDLNKHSEDILFREKEFQHQRTMDYAKLQDDKHNQSLDKQKIALEKKKIAAEKDRTAKTLAIQKMKARQAKTTKKSSK